MERIYPKHQDVNHMMSLNSVSTLDGNFGYKDPNAIPELIDGYRTFAHRDHVSSDEINWRHRYEVPGPDVIYKLNKNFFRTDNFENFDDSDVNILVAGCSWTFGEGIFQESIWAEQLASLISKKDGKPAKLYNLGVMGGSAHLAVKNIIAFINLYGKPDYVFIAFPFWGRDIRFVKKDKSMFAINVSNMMPFGRDKESKEAIKKYSECFDYLSSKHAFITQLNLLTLYLNAIGVTFKWISASPGQQDLGYDNQVMINHKFDLTVHERSPLSDSAKYPNVDDVPYWSLSKDGFHPGAAWHKDAAQQIFDSLESK